MFRAKRMTPAGCRRVSREASDGDISVPSKPIIRSWPIPELSKSLVFLGIIGNYSIVGSWFVEL
jgi:hypothetical protein